MVVEITGNGKVIQDDLLVETAAIETPETTTELRRAPSVDRLWFDLQLLQWHSMTRGGSLEWRFVAADRLEMPLDM